MSKDGRSALCPGIVCHTVCTAEARKSVVPQCQQKLTYHDLECKAQTLPSMRETYFCVASDNGSETDATSPLICTNRAVCVSCPKLACPESSKQTGLSKTNAGPSLIIFSNFTVETHRLLVVVLHFSQSMYPLLLLLLDDCIQLGTAHTVCL